MFKKFKQRYRVWKLWKCSNLNSRVYQVRVLVGLAHSATFDLQLLYDQLMTPLIAEINSLLQPLKPLLDQADKLHLLKDGCVDGEPQPGVYGTPYKPGTTIASIEPDPGCDSPWKLDPNDTDKPMDEWPKKAPFERGE